LKDAMIEQFMGQTQLLRGLLVILSVTALGGCAVNPVTGKNEVAFVSESQELALGKQNYGPYRQAQGGDYVIEPELTRYVQSVGDRLARASDRKLPYEFSILNDSTPNAWALPGGKIAFNRGLLVELRSEAELAAVLAHEIVHAAARHSAQSMERGVFLQGALIAAGVALGDSSYRDIGMMGAGLGAQLTNQKFGRDDESEADRYGMLYMARAGYDPAAAVRLQETFVRLSEGRESNWLEGLFASHPPSRARVEANRAELARLGNPGGEVGEDRYQKAIARLKRSKPAYAAYDEARAAAERGDLNGALAKLDKAIRIEPQEAAFYSLRGEIKSAQKNGRAALKDLDRAVALNPGYFRPLLVRGMTRSELADLPGARRDLERSVALLPTAEGYYGLGRAAELSGRREEAVRYFRKAASSQSDVGTQAGRQLARIDLQEHPERYLVASLGLSRGGYLVVRVTNRAPLAVQGVRVVIGSQGPGGIRHAAWPDERRCRAAARGSGQRCPARPLNRARKLRRGEMV
jgi:predicted Zn-dependent protease